MGEADLVVRPSEQERRGMNPCSVLTGRLRMESDPGGASVVEAGPDDFLFVPRGSIHRECNPPEVEGTAVVVRSGRSDPVVNVEGLAEGG